LIEQIPFLMDFPLEWGRGMLGGCKVFSRKLERIITYEGLL
jgi:hypothetical protein